MKILVVSSEGLPYSKTGGLADVVEALPKALVAMGHEVAVLLPRYHGNKITSTIIYSVTIALGDTLRFPTLAEGQAVEGVRYFTATTGNRRSCPSCCARSTRTIPWSAHCRWFSPSTISATRGFFRRR